MVPIFTLVGWWFLPERITTYCLPIIHNLIRSRGIRTPSPGTIEFSTHWRRLYATVIIGYLFYSLWANIQATPPNFYQILGVGKDADENELKLAFRNFAKRNHPDRVGPQGTDAFVGVKDAYDALKDPVTRFAYDR